MAAVQLTNAGAALVAAGPLPITLTGYTLGSGVNYIPAPTDTGIHGTALFSGVPSTADPVSANIVKYSVFLDYPTGPFAFGELGLFTAGGILFALAAWNAVIPKEQLTSTSTGNAIRIDVYLSIVGTNYAMWLDLAQTDNQFRFPTLSTVDLLPPSQTAIPNAYVISGASSTQSAFLAFTDQNTLWNFDAYTFSSQASATLTAVNANSVSISLAQYVSQMTPAYFGQVILEFATGAIYSICRNIQSTVTNGGTVQLNFANPLAILPAVGDIVNVYVRQSTTITTAIPVASRTQLGGVLVGESLTVSVQGLIDVDYTKITFPVTSVNGLTGVVTLTASNITGFAAVAISGNYTDLSNKPTPYTLPVATTSVLGGVRAPSTGNLTISGSGVIDLATSLVTSVNGLTGAVTLTASNITGFAAVAVSGNYTDLSNKPSIPSAYTLPPATTTVLGGVIVPGTSGLGVDGSGNIRLLAPSGSNLGGVKQGANIVIASDGTISNTPVITSVNGQIGATIVQAIDNNPATGNSWIFDSGATSGNIRLRTIVAGVGIALGTDTNGNIVVNGGTLSPATATVLGGVIIPANSGLTVDVSGNLKQLAPSGANIGGVKAGLNITIAADGTIAVPSLGVTAFNTRTGAVTLVAGDVTGVGGALLSDVAAAKYYDLTGGGIGPITSSQLLMYRVTGRFVNLPASLTNSQATCLVAPTGNVTLNVVVGGTTIGTIVFSAGTTTGVFSGTGANLTSTQVVTITAPASADATFATVSIVLVGLAL